MKKRNWIPGCIVVLALTATPATPGASSGQESPARGQVEELIHASGAEVGLAFQMLDGSQELFLSADQSFHAASTMKVPVMIELFAQVHEGKLSLADTLLIHNDFKSLADGSPYTLDANDDSDPDVYKAIGSKWTVRDLCEAMITRSSNLATNLIIEKLGVDNIRARVHSLGADGIQVLRGVEDGKAFEKGHEQHHDGAWSPDLAEGDRGKSRRRSGIVPRNARRSSSAKRLTKPYRPGFPPERSWRTKPVKSPECTTMRRLSIPRTRLCW